MLGKLFAICRTTFVETIRQPIYGVLMWTTFGLLLLNPSIAAFSLESGKDSKIMQDVGLSTLLLFGLLASVFSATGVLTREIESYTVLTIVSKPVSRPLFLVGKFLGVAAAVLVAFYFLSIVFLMTVRHGVMETVTDKYDLPVIVFGGLALLISLVIAGFGNFAYGWHFSTTLTACVVPLGTAALVLALPFSHTFEPQSLATDIEKLHLDQVLYAIVLIFLAVQILTALAVALSTRFSQVVTLVLCSGVFLLGLLSDFYLGRHAAEALLYRLAYAAIPNFQFFWIGDALTQDQTVPLEHVLRVARYAALQIVAVLALGIALFQTREVG